MTDLLTLSSPRPLTRQIIVNWLAGLIVALITGSGVGVNVLMNCGGSVLGAWCAGALFIPALALALGTWSRTNKLFEIVYVLLWYFGALHPRDIPAMDFLGASDVSIVAGMPWVYASLAVLCVVLASGGRWWRLR
jgi:hypothetical protein